jgi:hypothetical protein
MSGTTPSFEELLNVLQQLEMRLQHVDTALAVLADTEARLVAFQNTLEALLKFSGN